MAFDDIPASIEHIRAGKLRVLGVTTVSRSAALPDLPTIAEFVPGYEASAFLGMGTPTGTVPTIIAELNNEINAALADPSIRARLAEIGGIPLASSPAAFGRLIAEETAKWEKVIRAANINPV
jgi:tripartite-type tricarboxylate transporter receptor subunit TctC